MSYILIYVILLGKTEYTLIEPMYSLEQCRRVASIVETSEKVVSVGCGAVILDKTGGEK